MSTITGRNVTLENGETIYVREREGGTEPVLLIHGNMTSSKHWDVVLESMDEAFKIYAIDLRGFGNSTYHERFSSLKELAEDVYAVTVQLDLEPFSVIGWSTGGGVAMQFAADHPELVKKLVLMASLSTRGYPFLDHNGERIVTKEQIETDPVRTIPILAAYEKRDKSFLKKVWNASIYTDHRPEDARYEEYLEDMFTQRNLADIYHSNNHFNISTKYNGLEEGSGDIKKISAPTLVVWGKNDLVITRTMTDEIIEDFNENHKEISVKVLDAGHSPLIDQLPELLAAFEDFIR